MSIQPPDLDDRTFQDIVDEAKRMIPRYCPEWTNHNVSDPGVALIELFAWMSEMVLFRLNQVPERFYAHFLNMVGVQPFPPSVASVDLTFWLTAALDTAVVVPANTEVTTPAGASGAVDQVSFATTSELVIAPPELVSALTVTSDDRVTDVWEDLRYNEHGVRCFDSDPMTPGDTLCLGFAGDLSGMVLRVAVEAAADGIGVDPRKPPLAWEIWNGEGWLPALVNDDSTGGLNRAGEGVLLIPRGHQLLTIGNRAAFWLRVRLLQPAAGQPTYQASPRVRSVRVAALGGTVRAEHAQTLPGESIGRSDGRPGQQFSVGRAPVLPRRADEHVTVIGPDGTSEWTEVADFAESGPTDRHYVWESGSGTVRFGPRVRYADGTVRHHGSVPRDGAQIVVTGYRHGGGAGGNVGARTLTVLRTSLPFVRGAVNLASATGGVDAETVAEAKVRGPMSLRTGYRAVTAGDYERLTREASVEVARARCLPAARGRGAVRVLVVPAVRGELAGQRIDDYAIGASLLSRISEHLDAHRVVGTSVEVGTPFYQGVSVVALVHTGPGRPAALVRQRAIAALTRYVNPLLGGPHGAGWPFDAHLNAAAVTQVLESVDGVERVEEVLLFEYDLRSGRRLGAAKDVIRLGSESLFLSAGHQVVVR